MHRLFHTPPHKTKSSIVLVTESQKVSCQNTKMLSIILKKAFSFNRIICCNTLDCCDYVDQN